MRAIVLVPLFATACFEPVPDLDLHGCDFAPSAGDCVDESNPFKFTGDTPSALARSGKVHVDHLALPMMAYEIVSEDPDILRVEQIADNDYQMTGVAEGHARLQAFRLDNGKRQFLASMVIDVEPVSGVDILFDPAGETPVPALAALLGAREKLRIHARGTATRDLAGAEDVITFAYEGGIAGLATASAETRMGHFSWVAPGRTGYEVAFRADGLGPARIVARYEGREIGALPIEVVATADTAELVFSNNPANVGSIELAGLVGTANALPLAGLVGDFTLTPGFVDVNDLHAGELFMITKAAGIVEVTVTLPDRTLSGTLQIR
jgi:hypothetical protein